MKTGGQMLAKVRTKYESLPLPVKAGVWFTVCSIIQRGISVISMPIFTRLLSAADFGSYNLYTSWCMLLGLFITLNLQQEVFNKGLVDHDAARADYTTSQACLITLLAVIAYVVYFVMHIFVNRITGMSIFLTTLLFCEVWATAIVSLWLARRRFDYAYRPLAMVTVGISLASVVIGIVAVSLSPSEWKVQARVASNLLPFFAVAVVVFARFVKESECVFQREWWRQSIAMGVPLVPHYASQVLLNQVDKILIGWFLNNIKVAIYGVAHSAGLLLVMVNSGINSSFVPWLYGKMRDGNCESVPSVSNALVLIVVLFVFLLMLVAPECVGILATSEYSDAIWCIPPIATGVVFSFMYTLFVNVEIYYGRAGYVASASVLAAIVNVALNLIAIPMFGYIASAYVTSICYFCTTVLHYSYMNKTLKDAGASFHLYDIKFLIFATLLTCVSAAVSLVLYEAGVWRYVFIAAFLVSIFLFKGRLFSTIKGVYRKG